LSIVRICQEVKLKKLFTPAALWKSDGTPAGTIRVRDNLFPALLTNVDGTVFFVNGGSELWKSDGTLAGTQLIKAFQLTPPMPRFPPGPGVIGLTNLNGTLVFSAYDGTSMKLWRTDGTPSGTQALLAKNANIVGDGIVNNMLFFRLYNIDDTRDELWKTDGTIAGTTRVKESIHTTSFASGNNHIFFLESVANRLELWMSDGTEAGTHIVTPLSRPESELYYTAIRRVSADGRMLIAFGDPTAMVLWQSNGTERGTVRLQTPSFGMDHYSDPPQFTISGTQIFFTANEPNTGVELWTLDIDSLRAPARRGALRRIADWKGWTIKQSRLLARVDQSDEHLGLCGPG
jgi:ELWxxDGT repeat protein